MENRLRIVTIPAPRGVIYDHKGKILATNKLSHSLLYYPTKIEPEKYYKTVLELSKIVELSETEIEEKLKQGTSRKPVYIKHNLNQTALAKLLENQGIFPGMEIITSMGRFYPDKGLGAHLIGYTGEITSQELKQKSEYYQSGMIIGKNGLEKQFDSILRGTEGKKYYTIGKKEKFNNFKIPNSELAIPGHSLTLTLDKGLQKYCEHLLESNEFNGTILVMDVNTGGIMAMANRPTYDLNLFVGGINKKDWQELQQANTSPFLNRALNPYQPGSVFKIISTVAASEKNYVHPLRTFFSRGFLKVGTHIFYDWNRSGFGWVNMYKALAYSVDTVFYELSLEMGIDSIKQYAEQFRLNTPTGIELPNEGTGLIPDKFWKQQYYQQDWLPGDTVNTSIGQGFVQLTPLQALQMTAVVATRGNLLRPHLVAQIKDEKGRVIRENSKNILAKLNFKPDTWQMLQFGMRGAVTYGTAKAMGLRRIPLAGKTGTAETVPGKETHAWVVGYGPYKYPKYAVCVFLEHAGGGGSKAAPLGRKVFNYLFYKMDKDS